jgi:hypothetical protein
MGWRQLLPACLILGAATFSQSARSTPSYATAVLGDSPAAFWQLKETSDPSTGSLTATDSSGNGLSGTYGTTSLNGYNGITAPPNPPYLGFTANQGALETSADQNSFVTIPPLNLSTNTVDTTIAMWINPNQQEANATGLFFQRTGNDANGFGFGNQDAATSLTPLGYNWNNSAGSYNWNSGLEPQVGVWSFVVLVVQSNQATIYLDYTDPNTSKPVLLSAVHANTHTPESLSAGTIQIGNDSYNNNTTRWFGGSISDVSIFHGALTAQQVTALFAAGLGVSGFAPQISTQPVSAYVNSGSTVQFSASGINGTAPFTYQWKLNNVNVNSLSDSANFIGANSNVLTILNATSIDQGTYQLTVSNGTGSTVSSNATLTIQTAALVGHWFTNSTLADVSHFQPAGTHDGYDINGTGSYVFTNDVPTGKTGTSLLLYNGDTGIAISNSSTFDASYTNTFDDQIGHSFTVGCFAKGWPGTWNPFVSKYGENGLGWQLRQYGATGVNPCWTIRGTGDNDDMAATAINLASDTNNWHFYVGTYDANTRVRSLYVDGALAATETNNGVYARAPGSHLAIGARDAGTNTFGNYFTGGIYDVRVYNYSLSVSNIQAWYGVNPPSIAAQPSPASVFSGSKASFTVTASGTPPLAYQWQLNGVNVNLLTDATNFVGINSNVLTVLSASSSDVGAYRAIVTSTLGYGSITSSNAALSLVQRVLLGEWFTNGTLTELSHYRPSGTHDAYIVGGGNYYFTNDVPLGEGGQSIQFGSTWDTGAAIANSSTADGPTYTNTFESSELTVAFWAEGRGGPWYNGKWDAWVAKDGYNNDGEGNGEGWSVGMEAYSQNYYFDMEGVDAGGIGYTLGDGLWGNGILETGQTIPGDDKWHHYASTYNPETGIRSMYFDGVLVAQQTNDAAYHLAPDKHLTISCQEQTTHGFTGFSQSAMYDVRVYNYPLTASQILGLLPNPQISVQPPQARDAYVGVTSQLGATVITFNRPTTNQWQFNGTNLVNGSFNGATISGANSTTLTIANVTPAMQGVYRLIVSFAGGSLTSSNTTVTVLQPAAAPTGNLVGAWLTGSTNLADTSGYSPAGTHDGYGVNATGIPVTTYSFTTDVPPNGSGKSLVLSGTSAIAISNSSSLDASYNDLYDDALTNAFSVTFWAKGYPGNWNPWVSKYGEGPGWQMRDEGDNAHSGFTLRGNHGAVTLGTAVYGDSEDLRGTIASADSNWHFYAGTFDSFSSNRMWYVDGVLSAQVTGDGPYNLSPASHLTLGGKDSAAGNSFGSFFTGELYGVKIYNTALSEAQVNSFLLSRTPSFSGPPVMSGHKFVLSWSTSGTLLQSTNVGGPYVPVPGATSPFTNDVTTNSQMFYKLSN